MQPSERLSAQNESQFMGIVPQLKINLESTAQTDNSSPCVVLHTTGGRPIWLLLIINY